MRAGPAGRTAAERNSSHTGTEQAPLSMGQSRPDADDLGDEAESWIAQRWQEMREAGHPVSKRSIRNRLLAEWRRELAAGDAAAVLTFIRGGEVSRSVPVDPMAEGIVRKIA